MSQLAHLLLLLDKEKNKMATINLSSNEVWSSICVSVCVCACVCGV